MKKLSIIFSAISTLLLLSCADQEMIDGGGDTGGVAPEPTPILATYEWPTAAGQTKLSEYYRVWVTVDGEQEKEIQVVQSDPIVASYGVGEDFHASYTKQRSFSFVNVSYDESSDKELTFKVECLFTSAPTVKLTPRSYNLSASVAGSFATFKIKKSSKYISVDFDAPNNKVNNAGYDWIKHMLTICIDPQEKNVPKIGAPGVVPFTESAPASQLQAAKVIYFAPGYYNLSDPKNFKAGVVDAKGKLTTQPGQAVYIAGGAFVEGYIHKIGYRDQQIIRGRGILSGRQYVWQTPPPAGSSDKYEIMNIVLGGDNSIYEGVSVIESPQHGIVSTSNCKFDNIKFLGWHANNDGLRPGDNSQINNCFIRACDDFFYDYKLTVKNCVLWPAWNGSIMTTGWQDISIGGSLMEDIDIINPEWTSMGNNKGLIMSQNEYGFKPKVSNGVTTFRNIRFEGVVPGFINLKPASGYGSSTTGQFAPLDDISKLGWLGNILLENVKVDAQKTISKTNLIKGAKGANIVAGVTDAIWWVKDVKFKNVYIGETKLTSETAEPYFNIDPATTQNIVFE